MSILTQLRIAGALTMLFAASACSEGGVSPAAPPAAAAPPPAPVSSAPVFQSGVFQPASTFINRCEFPRSGVDIEGNRFPDVQGTGLLERFWLRSWTNETYLFNTEVVDRDPNGFSDRLSYFAVLRTTATTPSGRDRDEFHFTQPTDEFLAQANSAPTAAYGVSYEFLSASPPRDVRVRFTEPGSPAAAIVGGLANFVRGARILRVDGVDLVNASTTAEVAALNAGLFPSTAGETHVFVVQDVGAVAPRTVTLVSANLARTSVNRTRTIDTPTGRVGYLLLNTFSPFASEIEIFNAITQLRSVGVADLVVDLRYNGGGLLATASQLSFMIAGRGPTAGRTFEALRFNAAAGPRNPVTGAQNTPTPFFSTGLGFTLADGVPLPELNLPRVYILTTDATCSASESVINGLRGVGVEVILIGGTTCGKPFGFFPQDNCGVTYFTIQFQGVNAVGFGEYADGFAPANSADAFAVRAPGCAAPDDFTRDLGDPNEGLLAAALFHRQSGLCPSTPSALAQKAAPAPSARGSALVRPGEPVFDSNRDMRTPE